VLSIAGVALVAGPLLFLYVRRRYGRSMRSAAPGRLVLRPPRSRRPDPEESVTLQVLVNSSNPDFNQEVVDRHMRRVEVDLRV